MARAWSVCEGTERPCALACSCRYGLPDGACALDVAEAGEHTAGEVAALLRVPLEKVRQIETVALVKLHRGLA